MLQAMMDRWTAIGAEVAPRGRRKPSPSWFRLSAEVLVPAIEKKKEATKKYYRNSDLSAKIKLAKLLRQVADLVEAAKIRWVEKRIEELEKKYDPRGAWKAMRELSSRSPVTDNVETAFDELSPYSPLRSTTPTSTFTVDAIDAAIAAQTNLAADFDFEGDFFSFCDHVLDERDDLCL
jgi:hypothetical protein